MKKIYFPAQYKVSLLKGKKNTTIRIDEEMGRYQAGEVYAAQSYAGRDWGVKVKIKEVHQVRVSNLGDFGFPLGSREALVKRERLADDAAVELIRFEVVKDIRD
jgi:hypothetical protein